ncbi:NADPH:quinone reductase-like Zn-dependent oxidoreductase [Sphingomonas zeicaulis]|uniref:alcohol dehydrogenase catalytic domain-containing protein n=1 Tax=Sphingomonas zeicaulis TaxID=1632740 RepID=UPI003D1E2CC2
MPASPTAGQVMVRMLYAPINPADLLAIDGRYAFALPSDAPLGAEGVGRVEAVGADVADLSPGELVVPLSRGNWCRFRCLPGTDLIRLPPDTDLRQASMLRINPPTAHLLVAAAAVPRGQLLIQNAASSAVAGWVRTIAQRTGVAVVDIVRRADPALPDAIIDGDDLAEQVRARAAGRPVRAALDCVAGSATGRLAQCLSDGGTIMLFGHMSGDPVAIRSQLLTGGGLTIRGFSLRPAEAAMGPAGVREMFAELVGLRAQSDVAMPIRAVLPLSRAAAAITRARDGGRGRVLLDLTA